jgi:hypothetical protein
MAVVVVASDRRVFEGAVHPLNLSVRPGMSWFGQTMIDVVLGTGELERMRPEDLASFHGFFDQRGCRTDVAGTGEVGAVVGQRRMDLVRHSRDQGPQEVARHIPGGFLMQLGKSELAGAINGHQQIEPPFLRVHLSDVNVEVADGVGLNFFLAGLSPVTSGKRLMPCRCRQRCSEERVRCGMVG